MFKKGLRVKERRREVRGVEEGRALNKDKEKKE